MYPLPAVLVNCGEPRPFDVRRAVTELAVPVAAEFPRAEDLLKKWPTPPADRKLIVVKVQGLKQTAGLGKLTESFPGWPVVALVDGQPDAAGLYAVSRSGAAQIVPFPPTPEDLSLAFDRVVVQFALRPNPAKVIAVTGASPGCGATTLAANLAAEVAGTFEMTAVLVELEFVLGRLPGLLNLSPPVSVRDLLAQTEPPFLATVQSALTPFAERFFVLAGPHKRVEPFQAPAGRVAHLLGTLRRLATVTVADVPASFDPVYYEALSAADRVILVGRQDVPTFQAIKLLRDDLVGRGMAEPMVVLNQYDRELHTLTAARLGDLLGCPPPRTVTADSAAARAAADAGRPLAATAPHSHALADVRWVAAAVLKDLGFPTREVNARGEERRTLLGRLFGR